MLETLNIEKDKRSQQEKDDEIEANRPKYGQGIKTLRLFLGKI